MNFSKKSIRSYFSAVITCFVIFISNTPLTQAAIIFQDDFSKWPDNTAYTQNVPNPPDGLGDNGWDYLGAGAGHTYNTVTHQNIEINSPGRGGMLDKSVKIWKHGLFQLEYGNELYYYHPSLYNSTGKEFFVTWWMKVPFDFELSGAGCYMNYFKLWRFYVASQAACGIDCHVPGFEIYLNINGESFSKSYLQLGKSIDPGAGWKTLLPVTQIRDGQWHKHELRIKLNTAGLKDAEIQYWLDGIEKVHHASLDWGAAANDRFTKSGLGLGNTGARDCVPPGQFQEPWRAIEFDDYTISTTRLDGVIVAKKGDLNNNGQVDVTDLGILLSNWGATSKPVSDINQDGKVDVTDLGILLGNWG